METGDGVPAAYDAMIAKLGMGGPDRTAANDRLVETLAHLQVVGVRSNVGFVRRCASSEAFIGAAHHVTWIEEQGAALTVPPTAHQHASVLAVCDVLMGETGIDPWSDRDGWRMNAAPVTKTAIAVGDDIDWFDPSEHEVEADLSLPLVTDLSPRRFAVTTGGDSVLVEVPDYESEAEAIAGGDFVKAPMPGTIIDVRVSVGDAVSAGQAVALMEAMKMEHTLTAPRDGIVASISTEMRAQVGEGDVLVALETD